MTMQNTQQSNEVLQEVRDNGHRNTQAILKLESQLANQIVKSKVEDELPCQSESNSKNEDIIINKLGLSYEKIYALTTI